MNAKRKGTAGENELVSILQGAGIRAHRNDQIYKGGAGNPDVAAELGDLSLHIEVKRAEKLNIHEAMKQAIGDARSGSFPVVAHRRNREKWMITAPLEELISILREKGVIAE